MYKWVDRQPTVRESYVANLVAMGEVNEADAERIAADGLARLEADLARVRRQTSRKGPTSPMASIWQGYFGGPDKDAAEFSTVVDIDRLAELLRASTRAREGFHVHPKLERILATRRKMADGEQRLDWGAGETLAFASLLAEGVRVRLSGQDSQRGTFSHRHTVLHDAETGETWTPLQHLEPGQGSFEVWNSPLSEAAVLGFDYGYSLVWPEGLTIWEAQFGDFANGAQVIIDQFISSCEDKWDRLSGLVMLLPHGMEGQGPEHSSARLERFLTLASEDNIFVCNLTTPAQLFHSLRRQMRRQIRKPLVIMTPKWLLRLREATSALDELANGRFHKVLADVGERDPAQVKRVLVCSGKIYYELAAARAERQADDIAIVRIEQLYPLPAEELEQVLAPYADGTEVRWVQDEPVNMGAWVFLRFRLGGRLFGRLRFRRVTRPESASPATGSAASHRLEQARLMDEAFADASDDGPGKM
jgi:2-oxoglutarate dehydrogenase E1 component